MPAKKTAKPNKNVMAAESRYAKAEAGASKRAAAKKATAPKAPAKAAPAKNAAATPMSNRTPGVLPRMGVKAEGRVGTGIRATEWAYRSAARKAKMRKKKEAASRAKSVGTGRSGVAGGFGKTAPKRTSKGGGYTYTV